MTVDELRSALAATTIGNPFQVLRELCAHMGTGASATTQELVLRALDRDDAFKDQREVVDGLARELGLFPYLSPDTLSLPDQIAYELHRPANMGEHIVFHRPQAEVYRRLLGGENVILSAPTSFGKSLIIDGVIASGKFHNVMIVVPTIALIDETRRRLTRRFGSSFKVVTHPFQQPGARNIFIYTQERVLEHADLRQIDFFVIDEFYKLSPGRDDDDRCARLNEAFYRLVKTNAQFYLLGPNIHSVSPRLHERLSFTFLNEPYHTVVSQVHDVRGKRGSETSRLIDLCRTLADPTMIFCKSPRRAAEVTSVLLEAGLGIEGKPANEDAARWVGRHYHPEWHFARALRSGVGVHHGRIPRALAQYVVRAFDEGRLRFLVCTSTLIEGVNTKAKNIIVLDDKISTANIDLFTFNNIRGRSGRLGHHVIGNVYIFHDPPQSELPFVDVPAFTQPPSSDFGMLLQMDREDLTERSLERIRDLVEQEDLPYETLRDSPGVDPAALLAIARQISESPGTWAESLGWSGFPTTKQLQAVTLLIWKHFGGARLGSGSARSAKQLAYLINRLRGRPPVRAIIQEQYSYLEDWDAAVQQTLDFLRLWASFHYPRLLRAVSRVQRDVLGRAGLRHGDYDFFASQVENLFLDPVLVALDEYGIPLELARKIPSHVLTEGNLDDSLARLRTLNLDAIAGLDSFEIHLLKEVQENL
jgi:RAD3-like DEAD/DEAH box helicase/helicase-like protein